MRQGHKREVILFLKEEKFEEKQGKKKVQGRKRENLTGEKYGRLTVISDEGTEGKFHFWKCKCDCGNPEDVIVTQDHLKRGLTRSCGCLHDSVGKENLRLFDGTSVTKLEKRKGKINSNNTSGYTGVYEQISHGRKNGRWVAQIGFKGKRYFLGSYETVEEAAEARKKAEKELYGNFLMWYYQEYLPEGKKKITSGETDSME